MTVRVATTNTWCGDPPTWATSGQAGTGNPTGMVNVWVTNAPWTDYFRISSYALRVTGPAPLPATMDLDFTDFSAQALSSADLPSGAPSLASWGSHQVRVGSACNQVVFDIESAVASGSALTALPPSGAYVRAQHLDPALVMAPGTLVSNVQLWRGDGTPFAYGYDYLCAVSATTSDGRVVVPCPKINPYLAPGMSSLQWRVQLTDGNVFTKNVDWEVIP